MRKLLILWTLLSITIFQALGQTKHICTLDNKKYYESLTLSKIEGGESFMDNKEASEFIEKLIDLLDLDLPMNFKVHECNQSDCRNNAYAAMDIEGNRHIVYDNQWFKILESSNKKIESLTILAHEIGHHLAAHTLSLNYYNHEDAVKYCESFNNPDYNKEICEKQYLNEYLQYLRRSRKQELEADRFSGFIMNMYEVDLVDIFTVFRKISNEIDDTQSTHPSLKKRLTAIEQGYNLAEEKKKNPNFKIDLQKIKGGLMDFKIKNKINLERKRFIDEIWKYAVHEPINYMNKNSDIKFIRVVTGNHLEVYKKFIKYHGHEDKPQLVDKKEEYFRFISNHIALRNNPKVEYRPLAAVHIKDSIFKILIFEEGEKPKVIYSSPFREEFISYEEIKSIFIELYSNGIQNAIYESEK